MTFPVQNAATIGSEDGEYDSDGIVFGIATAGGGARAAAYTLGAFHALEDITVIVDGKQASALSLLDFVSGTSGGAWGAGAYVADRTAWTLSGQDDADYSLRDRRRAISEALALGTTVKPRNNRFERMNTAFSDGVTFGEAKAAGQPDVFFNATIYPSEAPFVFSDAYFAAYRVRELSVLKESEFPEANGVAALPIALGAFVSGAIPGFYQLDARTDICDDARYADGTYCAFEIKRRFRTNIKDEREHLTLIDGGVFDNYGYRTAFEVLDRFKDRHINRVIIQIDTTTNFPHHFSIGRPNVRLGTIKNRPSFLHQDAVYRRTIAQMGDVRGFEPIIIDGLAALTTEGDYVIPVGTNLWNEAQTMRPNTGCETGSYCALDNEVSAYWRAGRASKVSFLYDFQQGEIENLSEQDPWGDDWGQGTLMWQLGYMSTMNRRSEIVAAFEGTH
ncbi:MAG: patatin-like phospholipase family protein [Pseudomonadota bacterium]